MNYPHITKDKFGNTITWQEDAEEVIHNGYNKDNKHIYTKNSKCHWIAQDYCIYDIVVDNYPHVTTDSEGNEICRKNARNHWEKSDYDYMNNCIHMKFSTGLEVWREFDENTNTLVYAKNNLGNEQWYDINGNIIPKPNGNQLKTSV